MKSSLTRGYGRSARHTLEHGDDVRRSRLRPARRPAGQHRVQRRSQRVDVTRLGRRPAVENLGRRVRGGDRLQRLAQLHSRVGHRGQPEVRQPGLPVGVDQDVGRLHIPVQHALGMRGGQRVGDAYADLANPLLAGPGLPVYPRGQRAARTQCHHQVGPVFGQDAGVVHGHDPLVPGHPTRGPGLAQKPPLLGDGVQRALVDLDRDLRFSEVCVASQTVANPPRASGANPPDRESAGVQRPPHHDSWGLWC